jgi:RNA polymerase sigma factor (sigma-70 family)
MSVTLRRAAARLAARDERPDAALIDRFLSHADEAAFAEIVRRHGPMVLGVCRRFLGPTPDADDAFQATFLVLVRRARQMTWRESVGAWLYGVAVRVARKARAVRGRRRAAEPQVSPMTPEPHAPPVEPDDLAAVLDEELSALPEAYRRPLVLCELQGLARAAAARELGLREGTLSSRLARGRRMLRDRLARRGVGPAAAGLAAAVPAELASATVRGAAAVQGGAAGAVPAAVWSLTEGVVKAMLTTKLKMATVMAAVGVGLTLAGGTWADRPGGSVARAAEPPASQPVYPVKSVDGGTVPPAPPPAKPLDKDLFSFFIRFFSAAGAAGPPASQPVNPVKSVDDGKAPPASPLTYKPIDGNLVLGRRSGTLTGDGKTLPVATIFGDVPVTREAFAEYLISRYGQKELEKFVNKQIICRAVAGKGYVSRLEDLQAALDADAKALGLTRGQFLKDVLPRYGKTETEWMEDVIEPRLMMAFLCGEKVKTATDEELKAAFDRKYGEKRECRMILCLTAAEAEAIYRAVADSEEAFAAAARRQPNSTLAATGGRTGAIPTAVPAGRAVVPAGRADEAANKAATALRAGEVSRPVKLDLNGGFYVVLKCDQVIPADASRKFADEKAALLPEVLQEKLNRETQNLFDDLKRQANPTYHLPFDVPVPVKK